MKHFLIKILLVAMMFAFMGCGKTKILTCDACGADVKVKGNSNMTEEWLVYCEDCALAIDQELIDLME